MLMKSSRIAFNSAFARSSVIVKKAALPLIFELIVSHYLMVYDGTTLNALTHGVSYGITVTV